jgi:hypothetical protein
MTDETVLEEWKDELLEEGAPRPTQDGGEIEGGLSAAEIRLIRRIRTLQIGMNLVIIQVDGCGVSTLTLLESGRVEMLR